MERSLFRDIRAMVIKYRKRLFFAFLMVLTSNSLLVANPLVFRKAVTEVEFHQESPLQQVMLWALALFIISITAAYFKYAMRVAFISISRDVEMHVRSILFERIQRQSRSFFDRHGIGDLMSRLTNDISAYRDVLGPGVMYPVFFATLVVPAVVALFSISFFLALISLIPILFLPFLVLFSQGYVYKMAMKTQQALASMSNMTHEVYSGVRVIKSYRAEKRTFVRFKESCRQLLKLNVILGSLQGMIYPFLTLITKVVTVVIVIAAGFIILKAWGDLTTADFISFMWIQSFIYAPVLMLGWVLPIYQRGGAAYDRLYEIYNEPIEVKDNPHSTLKVTDNCDIKLSRLTFSYPEGLVPALNDVNLHIKSKSFVGITGPVGSGKTTIFRLLNREYEIPRGMITLGGHDIHDYSLEELHKNIVTVEQLPFLFSKTIAENISFGCAEATEKELELVIRQTDLFDTVESFPDRYETLVGERGTMLSGGQKQRVAMARAFLVDRSILLLDDVFSAIDASTEKKIFDEIKVKFAGKTVLLITHRISILEQLDRVVYLMNGHVVEDGSPKELMAQNGHFAALAALKEVS